MKKAVLYARVSSRDQEREGFSIPAQQRMLREYAVSHGLLIVKEFVDVETAKQTGRKQFGEMARFFEKTSDCRTVIVEKTDRLYRNFRDSLTLEDLGVEIHLVKDGLTLSKESKSQEKLVHGFHLLLAKNYSDNLREEVCKGMREKAAQGIYPGRAPLGYRNNKVEHTIEIDPSSASVAQRLFELYATGKYSLASLREAIHQETGRKIPKSYLEKVLKNPFYCGLFVWSGKTYQGTHAPLIGTDLCDSVQEVFRGHNRSRYRKHEFAFSGLLQCAHDNCTVTAERKKGKYVYYRCSGYRGKCALPRFREADMGLRLGQLLKDIHIPDDVLESLQRAIREDQNRADSWRKHERQRLEQRLAGIRTRLDQAYSDKLDGKITEDFWQRKTNEWQHEEQQVLLALNGLQDAGPDRVLTANRILELANKAYFLYVRQNPVEQGKLLKIVLSNCAIDGASLYPNYKKPFDLICKAAKNQEWSGEMDLNHLPEGVSPVALTNKRTMARIFNEKGVGNVRYYEVRGVSHSGGENLPDGKDRDVQILNLPRLMDGMVEVLDAWVEKGIAPPAAKSDDPRVGAAAPAIDLPDTACPLGRYFAFPTLRGVDGAGSTGFAPYDGKSLEPLDGQLMLVDMNENGRRDQRETITLAWRRLGLLKAGETFSRDRYVACVQNAAAKLRSESLITEQVATLYVEEAGKTSFPSQ